MNNKNALFELEELLKSRYDDEITTHNLFENIEIMLNELKEKQDTIDKANKYIKNKKELGALNYVDMNKLLSILREKESDSKWVIN